MNGLHLGAGILSLIATVVHGWAGESWVVTRISEDRLPATLFGDASVTKRLIRFAWHGITADFLVSGVALVVLATLGGAGLEAAARIISLRFFGYVLLVVILSLDRPRILRRLPQVVGLAAIAVLAWWGA
jgi:hypothetical protein